MLLWPGFDLDAFLDRTAARLAGIATIDRSRVIVVGHSGAGCNIHGGLATALHAKTTPLADLVIDTSGTTVDACVAEVTRMLIAQGILESEVDR